MIVSKVIEILIIVAVAIGGYYFLQHQRDVIKDLESKLEATNVALSNFDKSVASEQASRARFYSNLQEFAESEKANRIAVNSGVKQLRVDAICPKAPETGNVAGVEGSGAILSTSASQRYFDTEDNIYRNEQLLEKCKIDFQALLDEFNCEAGYECRK